MKGTNKVDVVKYQEKTKRLYINEVQYFDGVEQKMWAKQHGGYCVIEKLLKDRRGLKLGHTDIEMIEKVCEGFLLMEKVVKKIDEEINLAGGWPLANVKDIPRKKAA